ncbi:MAG TPA: DnaB-like helicase N-terminal domain-containing protein [Terriglobales bacterium]|nr:DnaB-like helicase N-terminal domain-containing protein [Terriglobales bacterium]
MKPISHHESPESAQPFPAPGLAHIDDIVEPEGEETAPQPTPRADWTVIAEDEIVQPHPHLAAEIVLLVSVIGDNSLCDLLTNFVPDCFCSMSHQSIFKAMLSLRARGITISSSTVDSHCSEGGEVGIREYLSALLLLLPLFAVDQATFYRYMGTVKYQWLTRRLQWCLQTTIESSAGGCSPVHLIDSLQQALSNLKGEYDLVNRPAAIEQQFNNYSNAQAAASNRCFSGNFDT